MMNIAIDGPAGAGKSTVAKRVAQHLGCEYLDTGAMYRGAAYYMLEQNISLQDQAAVINKLPDMNMQIEYQSGEQKVIVNGIDITGSLRTPKISNASSDIATIAEVRQRLVEIQRKVAQNSSLVMDGRDIGTYVLPEATYKFFVTATPQERAKRRYLEEIQKNPQADREQIERDIVLRDKNDMERDFAPLKKAKDAVLIDTTDMSIEEVVCTITDVIRGGK